LAWKQANPNFLPGFRQDLTYEQILREQVKVCLECYNYGDRDGLSRSVDALDSLITPRISDSQFREDMDALDDEWQEKTKTKEKDRKKALSKAGGGCPDLIPEVDGRPDMGHLRRKLYTILSLLERKHMGLDFEVEIWNEQPVGPSA
jgi:hypothetical protein